MWLIMINYLLCACAGLLFSIRIGFSKKYESVNGTSLRASLIFTTLFSIFGVFTALCFSGFKVEFSAYSLLFAGLIAVIEIVGVILSMKILKEGSSLMYTLFLLSGGMFCPFIYGIAFLGENPSGLCIIGTVMVVMSLVIPLFFEKKKPSWKLYLLCTLAFLFNGGCSIVLKAHQITTDQPIVSSTMFTFYYFAIMAVLCPIIFAFTCIKKENRKAKIIFNKWVFICAIAYAIIGTGASCLNVYCASVVPATIQFAIVTTATILGSFFVGWLVYKEKVNKISILQLIVAVSGAVILIF